MVNLRVLLTREEAVVSLKKACTIAARYSCVRRQGSLKQKWDVFSIIVIGNKLFYKLDAEKDCIFGNPR